MRLLSALLGVDYSIQNLDFPNQEQQSAAFRAINPKGEVPTLVADDVTLTDSSSILTWVAATNPGRGGESNAVPSSYWSSDLREQVGIIEWLAFANG